MTDDGSFYYNDSEFEIEEMQKSLVFAYDHLIERMGEHIRFFEALEAELDCKEEDDVLLQQFRDESVCLSGTRIKLLEEIRAMRKIFADNMPASVPDDVLLKASTMFKDLVLTTSVELYAPHFDLSGEAQQKLVNDLRVYTLALSSIGHSKVPLQVSSVYPFNDMDAISPCID